MGRIDRLYAIREELRRAGPAGRTAERLAKTFEVSVRTIKRDISTLQTAGFPVWARPGPGGGYVVDASATLPPVDLTEAEISGLAAAVAANRGQPFASQARAALVKILAVRARAQEHPTGLATRLWIDRDDTALDPRTRRAVEQALHERRVLSLRYRDRHGEVTTRAVDPVLLAHTGGAWYVVAYCRNSEGIRWFRFDRIQSAQLTSDPAADIPVEVVGTPPSTAHAVTDI